MTLSFGFYCTVTLTIMGMYHLPYFELDNSGNKVYPKFFPTVNIYTDVAQDGTSVGLNYTYPSTFNGRTYQYCDNVLDCEIPTWKVPQIRYMYDNLTAFTFTLRYVDDNGNQDRRNSQITPIADEQVTEQIFGSFEGHFHCPNKYETEHFRKVFAVTKPDGNLFNEYSTYVNFTIYATKIGCTGNCDKNSFVLRDYSPFEEQFDEITPIPEEPVQTDSENSE